MFIVKEDLPYDADLQTIVLNTQIAAGIEIPDARYKIGSRISRWAI